MFFAIQRDRVLDWGNPLPPSDGLWREKRQRTGALQNLAEYHAVHAPFHGSSLIRSWIKSACGSSMAASSNSRFAAEVWPLAIRASA